MFDTSFFQVEVGMYLYIKTIEVEGARLNVMVTESSMVYTHIQRDSNGCFGAKVDYFT